MEGREKAKQKLDIPAEEKPIPIRPMDLAIVTKPVKSELDEIDEYVAERTRMSVQVPPGFEPPPERPPEQMPIHVHTDSFEAGMKAALEIEW